MDYLYYSGCSLKRTAIDYDESFRAIADGLGIEFKELQEATCCGATVAKSVSRELADALPLPALTSADREQMALLTLCPSCHLNHKQMAGRLEAEPAFRESLSLKGVPQVKQLLEVLAGDVGTERIRERTVRSLAGIRAVPYYGCLVARPFPLGGTGSIENPTAMEGLIEATGAEAVSFPYKTDCCGGAIFLSREQVALKLTASILREAATSSPDCLVVACPLCHFMLDAKQRVIEKETKKRMEIPVLYITQLLGVAMGLAPDRLGLQRLITSPKKFLAKISPL